jgi:hypothetical protein
MCDKFVKVYRRKFNSRMARILVDTFRLFEAHPGKYLDIGTYLAKEKDYIAGEHGKLVTWGLLERKPEEPKNHSRSNGLYRMTPAGFEFVYNRSSVPSHLIEYRSEPLDWDGKINIVEALGKGFDYPELMREPGQ